MNSPHISLSLLDVIGLFRSFCKIKNTKIETLFSKVIKFQTFSKVYKYISTGSFELIHCDWMFSDSYVLFVKLQTQRATVFGKVIKFQTFSKVYK